MPKKEKKKEVTELEDLQVKEVSIVDNPANLREFIIVKRATEGSDMPRPKAFAADDTGDYEVISDEEATEEEVSDAEDEAVIKAAAEATAEAAEEEEGEDTIDLLELAEGEEEEAEEEAEDDSEEEGEADPEGEIQEILKAVTVAQALKPLNASLQQMMAACNDVKKVAYKSVPKEAAAKFKSVAVALNLISGKGNVEKAEWTTAYVNNLPDSSFLYIAPGGKKDADGKTTPRSKRYFPVKDAAGKVDLPHLRNALARIPQSKIPDAAKKAATSAAQKMLQQATKKNASESLQKLMGLVNTIKGMKQSEAFPSNLASEVKAIAGSVSGLLETSPAASNTKKKAEARVTKSDQDNPIVVIKAGRKMKKTRLAKLREAVTLLSSILKELEGEPMAKKEDGTKKQEDKVEKKEEQPEQKKEEAKQEDAKPEVDSGLKEEITKLTEAVTGFSGKLEEITKRVTDLEGAAPTGNAEEDPPEEKVEKKRSLWDGSVIGEYRRS